ncbi:MAG: UbiA family prenyltransferase [Candidatus Eisenbacteria bacterium]
MRAWLRLLRAGNLVILGGAILLGHALAGGGSPTHLMPALFAAAFLVGAFYLWNDVADLAVDRINRPDRPLPSGAIAEKTARRVGTVLLPLAFCCALGAGVFALGTIALWSLLLLLYERYLKRAGFAGNLLVSAVASSALLYGARLGGAIEAGIAPALFAFFLHLAREIVKDIQDMPGDPRGARRTLPLSVGGKRALLWCAFPLALLVLFSPVPFLIGMYNVFYLAIVIVGIDLLLAVALFLCYARPDRARLGMLARLLKGQMVVGMAAILVGSAF